MRLFVAIEIGSDVQATASRVIEDLKRRTEQSAPHARVTWVKPGHLHLTVCFIGHAESDLSQKILSTMAGALRVPPFEFTIQGTGTFPARRPPRVVWAGVTAGLDQLLAVEQEVRSRLDRLVPCGEERDYHPHLTLGRVKNPVGLRPAVLLEGLERTVFGAVDVQAVTLFESRLSSSGPTYISLGRAQLGRAS